MVEKPITAAELLGRPRTTRPDGSPLKSDAELKADFEKLAASLDEDTPIG